jgi:hypothetical protein
MRPERPHRHAGARKENTVVGRPFIAVLLLALTVAACGTSTPSIGAGPSASAAGSGAPSQAAATPAPSATTDPNATPEATEPLEYQATEDLRVGDCYNPVEDVDDQTLLAAIVVPCDTVHRHEVFGLEELPGASAAPFPGDDAVDSDAIDLCDAAFEAYVGIALDNSRYSYVYYVPTDSSWAGGDRVVMCAVEDRRDLEESVEGTER